MAILQFDSISVSAVRSVVEIAEAGSISKAARSLSLSQPAISMQLKRIEDFVGGRIFDKSSRQGFILTDLGRVVLIQARKILEANTQLGLLRGSVSSTRPARIGVSELYIGAAFGDLTPADFNEASIIANNSNEIIKGLMNGFIDIGLFFQPLDTSVDSVIKVLHQRNIDLVWVRSPTFALPPGVPIPLLTSESYITHEPMVYALKNHGLNFRIALSSRNHAAHIEAAKRGIGIMALPRSLIPKTLIEAKDYYLPSLPSLTIYLATRGEVEVEKNKFIASLLHGFFSKAD